MERYSFFNAVVDSQGQYDREYLAEDFARYFASVIGNGVFANSLKVSANGSMGVSVAAGKAWINGYFYENTEAKNLTINAPSGTMNRIDNIVVRLDLNSRMIALAVVKGSDAYTPAAPALTRNESVYELCIAEVAVNANAATIITGNIKDTRAISEKCGWVAGVVTQIDTDGVFSAYDEEFRDWFENVKTTLSGDVAGQLKTQIDAVETSVNSVETRIDNITGELEETFQKKEDTMNDVSAAMTQRVWQHTYRVQSAKDIGTNKLNVWTNFTDSNPAWNIKSGAYLFILTISFTGTTSAGSATTRFWDVNFSGEWGSQNDTRNTVPVVAGKVTTTNVAFLCNVGEDRQFAGWPQIYTSAPVTMSKARVTMVKIADGFGTLEVA